MRRGDEDYILSRINKKEGSGVKISDFKLAINPQTIQGAKKIALSLHQDLCETGPQGITAANDVMDIFRKRWGVVGSEL